MPGWAFWLPSAVSSRRPSEHNQPPPATGLISSAPPGGASSCGHDAAHLCPQAPSGPTPFLLPCPGASSACLGMGAPHFSMAVAVKGKFLVMGRQPPVLVLTTASLQQLCQGQGEGSWHTQRMLLGCAVGLGRMLKAELLWNQSAWATCVGTFLSPSRGTWGGLLVHPTFPQQVKQERAHLRRHHGGLIAEDKHWQCGEDYAV